ncbi:MAG: hypothetical protein WBL27_03255 [Salinimicrobium sp.]
MRKFAALLVLFFSLQSCNSILFTSAQPKDSPVLKEFPENMLGTFVSEDIDTLVVASTSFIFRGGDPVQLSGDITPKDCALKKMDDWYIISLQDEEEWEVFPIKVKDNDNFSVYFIDMQEDEEKAIIADLQKDLQVKKVYNDDGSFDHYLINPGKKQFKRLLKKNIFSEEMPFKRVD